MSTLNNFVIIPGNGLPFTNFPTTVVYFQAIHYSMQPIRMRRTPLGRLVYCTTEYNATTTPWYYKMHENNHLQYKQPNLVQPNMYFRIVSYQSWALSTTVATCFQATLLLYRFIMFTVRWGNSILTVINQFYFKCCIHFSIYCILYSMPTLNHNLKLKINDNVQINKPKNIQVSIAVIAVSFVLVLLIVFLKH